MNHTPLMQSLTFLGGIPFVVCTLALWLNWPHITIFNSYIHLAWEHLLVTYTAIILSFLGGIHWGALLNKKRPHAATIRTLWSNIISLSAWLGVLLIEAHHALWFMLVLYISLWISDTIFAAKGLFPHWFGTLRMRISSIVVPCLTISAITI